MIQEENVVINEKKKSMERANMWKNLNEYQIIQNTVLYLKSMINKYMSTIIKKQKERKGVTVF